MRKAAALCVLLLLASCATSGGTSLTERVRGCWISRDATSVATLRWLPDPEFPGGLAGNRIVTGPNTNWNTNYTLRPDAEGLQFCQIYAEGPRCWQVAQGASGSLRVGRAFFDVSGDRLRMSIVSDASTERVLFNGRRDGCD